MPIGAPISHSQHRHHDAAVDSVDEPAAAAGRRRGLREHLQRQAVEAAGKQRPEDRRQTREPERGRKARGAERDGGGNPAPLRLRSYVRSARLESHQQQARRRDDDEGQYEQQQSECDQR